MTTSAGAERTLFDFSTAGDLSSWQVVNDDVMGGVSAGRFDLASGAALFRGELSLENDGGFASVRSAPSRQDLAGCEALVVRVRGDGRRYRLTVRTGSGFDAPLHQCPFPTRRGEWEEHRLAFRDFVPTLRGRVLADVPPLDPAGIVSVGFLVSDRQAGPFELRVEWIRAVGR